jgi:hypothetical protein
MQIGKFMKQLFLCYLAVFFFSEKPRDRIKTPSHFLALLWLYFGMLHAINPFGKEEISYFRNLPFTIPKVFCT